MLRSTYEDVQRENYTLRDALREANNELRKHRNLISGLRDGRVDVTRSLERVLDAKQRQQGG